MLTPLEKEMLAAMRSLFENCAMTHKHWGDGCNQKEADAAKAACLSLIAKAEAAERAGNHPEAWQAVLPDGWEIRRREEMLDAEGKIEKWAAVEFYVLDGRTDVRGQGHSIRDALQDAGVPFDLGDLAKAAT